MLPKRQVIIGIALLKQFELKVHLATVALVSFILAFVTARTYATLFPTHVLLTGGLHIHHFWFGLIFLAIGGWLGINYNSKGISIAAAILYGVGGGLIMDEVGLLLTFGNYQSELTWTILVTLLAFVAVLMLLYHNRQQILEELGEFATSKAALTVAIFLGTFSVAFIAEANNFLALITLIVLTAIAAIIIVFFIFSKPRNRS
jgi:hypothetical protein